MLLLLLFRIDNVDDNYIDERARTIFLKIISKESLMASPRKNFYRQKGTLLPTDVKKKSPIEKFLPTKKTVLPTDVTGNQ